MSTTAFDAELLSSSSTDSPVVLTQQDLHSQRYNELIGSLERFIPHEEQEKFRNAHILIAGCGSIGNPIAEMAVMQGAENVVIADPDRVEEGNMSRQRYQYWQVGKNKAQMTALNLRLINAVPPVKDTVVVPSQQGVLPNLNGSSPKREEEFRVTRMDDLQGIRSVKDGITHENVERYVAQADVVVDGIDIRALDMIFELHKEAQKQRKPVIVGYDMAGTAMIAVYRYDLKDMQPLDGALTEENIEVYKRVKEARARGNISEADFMNFVYSAFNGPINPLKVPVEQLEELITRTGGERTPQVGTTATMLSAMAIETMRRILNGERVNDVIIVDNPTLVRKHQPSFVKKAILLCKAVKKLNAQGQEVHDLLHKLES